MLTPTSRELLKPGFFFFEDWLTFLWWILLAYLMNGFQKESLILLVISAIYITCGKCIKYRLSEKYALSKESSHFWHIRFTKSKEKGTKERRKEGTEGGKKGGREDRRKKGREEKNISCMVWPLQQGRATGVFSSLHQHQTTQRIPLPAALSGLAGLLICLSTKGPLNGKQVCRGKNCPHIFVCILYAKKKWFNNQNNPGYRKGPVFHIWDWRFFLRPWLEPF